jgi:hypothetical protein
MGKPMPLFDYELDIDESMKHYKHILILKARGLGITEFILRKMCWMAVYDNRYAYTLMPIIVGPGKELSLKMIDRVKAIFRRKLNWFFEEEKRASFLINNVQIEAFASHNPSAYRSIENVPFVFIDEADFFFPRNQDDALDAAEGYIAKSNPWIFLVSTPDAPRKLMDRMIRGELKNDYKQFLYPYTVGLGKIYTQAEIDDAKQSPSFEREYNLKFLGRIGNVFRQQDIQASLDNGTRCYDPQDPSHWNHTTGKVLGVDPGFASSACGFCVIQMRNGGVEVLHADDLETPSFEEVVEETFKLIYRYGLNKIFIDSSNQSLIETLKDRLGEKHIGYEYDNTGKRKLIMLNHVREVNNHPVFSNPRCTVIPCNYQQIAEEMLDHTRMLVESGLLRLHPSLDKLTTALKTATANESKLIKEQTSYCDIFDAFRQCMLGIQPSNSNYES